MGALRVCCALVLATLIAGVPAPPADYDEESSQMAVQNTQPIVAQEVSDQLVNGGYANDETTSEVVKGPKVNGGFAMNFLPRKRVVSRVANGDCAGGHYVDGRCVRSFPKTARVATLDDNMLSPEQAGSSFEPDIHTFVKKHFGQVVMKDTEDNRHHDGMPGLDIVANAMNENGNEEPDAAAQALLPIGANIMQGGDEESAINLYQEMNHGHKRSHLPIPSAQAPAKALERVGDASGSVVRSDGAAKAVGGARKAVEGARKAVEGGDYSSNDGETSSADPVVVPPTPDTGLGENPYVAAQPLPVPEVVEEEEDMEEIIPQAHVAEEKGLPPTPTPTPTPNLEELYARQQAEQERVQQVESCLGFLKKQQITCTGTDEEKAAMEVPSEKNEETTELVQSAARLFAAEDPKGSFQAMVAYCTQKAASEFSGDGATLAQALTKYSMALSCSSSKGFPECLQGDAAALIGKAPSEDGQWQCF